jgi:hypothetical protein
MSSRLKYWLVGFQAVFVLVLAAVSSRPIPFSFARPMTAALLLWVVGLLYFSIRGCVRSPSRPLTALVAHCREERRTIWRAFEWALILGLAVALHGWAKSMLPHASGYWADPYLADFDQRLFGQDPWRLFRSDLLAPVYAKAYVCWFFITFGVMGVLAFSKRDHSRLFNCFLVAWILGGTVGQYVLPSAGPIFFERIGLGPRFAELVATNDPSFGLVADYLWKFHQQAGASLGTGISAMPSMHVTMAVWTMLAARAIWRPLALPAAIYALIIYAASIASGWHYATDGMVGLVVAVAAHRLCAARPDRASSPVALQPTASAAV